MKSFIAILAVAVVLSLTNSVEALAQQASSKLGSLGPRFQDAGKSQPAQTQSADLEHFSPGNPITILEVSLGRKRKHRIFSISRISNSGKFVM